MLHGSGGVFAVAVGMWVVWRLPALVGCERIVEVVVGGGVNKMA